MRYTLYKFNESREFDDTGNFLDRHKIKFVNKKIKFYVTGLGNCFLKSNINALKNK